MKKLFTFSFVFIFAWTLSAQMLDLTKVDLLMKESLHPTRQSELALQKVVDSSVFLRINQAGELNLELKQISLYDSLARAIRDFGFNFDINADTLLYTDQVNTTYAPPKIIQSNGQLIQNQYTNIGRQTQTFTTDEVLVNTLNETWDANAGSYINHRNTTNYFIDNSTLVDSIITEFWNTNTQTWELSRWDFQYFGNDELRDSVYTYFWDANTGNWKLTNKLVSEYDALGQQTNLRLFEWDTNTNQFSIQLDIYEFYNGDELKDSAHVYSYFGGYYGESKSIFTYENELPIADTIYNWNAALNQLQLTNYQSYQYDADGDLTVLMTYAYDQLQNTFTQITQVNHYYSTIDIPSTHILEPHTIDFNCSFANPHPLGSTISCDFKDEAGSMLAKVYDLSGKMQLSQTVESSSFHLKGNLPTGIYLLSLENESGQVGLFKLLIN